MVRGMPIRVLRGPARDRASIQEVVPLLDARYLRVWFSVFLEDTAGDGRKLKVERSSFQYQVDADGTDWVFRYDYSREQPAHQHPRAHLQVRGSLVSDVGTPRGMLERVHFPTGRHTLEGVMRCLAQQFLVPTNEDPGVWRALLAETERLFLERATQPISGPDR